MSRLFGFCIVLLPIFLTRLQAQVTDQKLQSKLEAIISGHKGNVALYVKNLKTGKVAAIQADSIFSTASMVKVPLLVGIMNKMNNNELSYHQELIYHDSLLYPGVDILGSFKPGEKIELSKLMMLMMTMSDNTASIWLQLLAGTGTTVNRLMDTLGFVHTRVNSRTPGREAAREVYGWGQTTPREMATLFERIYRGEIISRAACDRMLRCMNRNYWDGASASQIPPAATVFSKNGALDEYRSETVLVRGHSSEYVFSIITNKNSDTSWTDNNEAWVLMRKVSSALWNYFEPSHTWMPAVGWQKFN